jgi:hypothetical protein
MVRLNKKEPRNYDWKGSTEEDIDEDNCKPGRSGTYSEHTVNRTDRPKSMITNGESTELFATP